MDLQQVEQELKIIKTLLLSQKTVLNFAEVAAYMGLSKSYLYKLTHTGQIPHFKPQGKHIYFNKAEVDLWLQRNPVAPISTEEIKQKADTYITLKSLGRAKV